MANLALLEDPHTSIPIDVLSVEETPAAAKGETTLELVELLLKDPRRLQQLNRDPQRQAELVPRFLLIALAGYLIYSSTMVLLMNVAPTTAAPGFEQLPLPPAHWKDGSALSLPLAYTLSIVLASCVCLPSFYFYSLLAGVRITWLQMIGLIARATAYNGVILLGLVPIYVALMLGLIVFGCPPEFVGWSVLLGLALPFVAGLWGLRAIHRGIADLAAEMPPEWRCRRECLLRRLTLAWAAVYTAVLPVMIYRLWEYLAQILTAV